jgi:hypothetical protein
LTETPIFTASNLSNMAKKFAYNEQKVISGLAQFNTELDEHIGKRVRYKNPTCLSEKEEYEIRHIQRNHKGDLCFNLIGTTEVYMGTNWIGSPSHQFGACANPEDVYFV